MIRYLRLLLRSFAIGHLLFGFVAVIAPRWFYESVPPWPPLHVGQIQIAGVFDLALAVLFFVGANNLDRYLPVVVSVGAVAELGHAFVRICHVVAGDNPPNDLLAPTFMLLFGLLLAAVGGRAWAQASRQRSGAA